MKSVRFAALPLLLLCTGCVPSLLVFNEPKPPPPPVVKAPPRPVTSERVNAANAHQICDQLREEVDRAESLERD